MKITGRADMNFFFSSGETCTTPDAAGMGRKQTMVGDGRWRVHRLEQYKNDGFNDAHEPKRLKRMIYGNHGPPHSLLFSPEIQKFGITCMAFCLVARVACKDFFWGGFFLFAFIYHTCV